MKSLRSRRTPAPYSRQARVKEFPRARWDPWQLRSAQVRAHLWRPLRRVGFPGRNCWPPDSDRDPERIQLVILGEEPALKLP